MAAIDRAYSLAESALARYLPERWLHVQSVASLAEKLSQAVSEFDSDALIQAAWLHDIGYSPQIVDSGFHPLDGARYLAAQNVSDNVVALVAHHSAGAIEARLREVEGLDAYPDELTPTRDALWYCDASTGPQGQRWTARERWSEVRQRYGANHIVTRFLDEAEPLLYAAVVRTERHIQRVGHLEL